MSTTSAYGLPIPFDVATNIFPYLEDSSLFAWSQITKSVHQSFQSVLTSAFFQKRFFEQHPYLREVQDKILITLRNNQPSNCWKIACSIFSRVISNASSIPIVSF